MQFNCVRSIDVLYPGVTSFAMRICTRVHYFTSHPSYLKFICQGIMHTSKPIFTAQFHPEHFGGPTDTEVTHCI